MMQVTGLSELTIDGKMTLGPGASSKDLFAYSSDALKVWFHQQRAMSDAIMVGAGTVRTDDPELTVRYVDGNNPLRVVPCGSACLPLESKLLNDRWPTLVAVSDSASDTAVLGLRAKPGVEVMTFGRTQVDLAALLQHLAARGVERLMVEGGSTLLRNLFEAGLVTRIIIKHIPVVCGHQDAPTYLDTAGMKRLPLPLSQWQLDDWFTKGGIGISVYSKPVSISGAMAAPMADSIAMPIPRPAVGLSV